MMSVGDNAGIPMLPQVLPQPNFLRRIRPAPTQARSFAIRVQHHHVPCPQLIAVIPLACRPGLPRPILVIRRSTPIPVFMVAERRPRPRLEFAPRPAITILKFSQRDGVVRPTSQRTPRP